MTPLIENLLIKLNFSVISVITIKFLLYSQKPHLSQQMESSDLVENSGDLSEGAIIDNKIEEIHDHGIIHQFSMQRDSWRATGH